MERPDAPAPDEPVSARVNGGSSKPIRGSTPTTTSPPFSSRANWRRCSTRSRARFKGVLESLVIDTESDHNTQDTARRVAKMYLTEVFRGRYVPPPPVTEFPNAECLNELMIVGPITVRSACSHHFCPIMGRLWIGLMPNEHSNLIGLSKYSRLAEWIMSRPQIQEEAIAQMAELLMDKVSPTGWRSSWRPIISACTGAG